MPGDGFAAWIDHLRRRGSVVVYPRYRVGSSDASEAALLAFRIGVVEALHRLMPIDVPILALGKSFGGSAVFYYAAEATAWGVARPAAVVSIFPAYPIGALPSRRSATEPTSGFSSATPIPLPEAAGRTRSGAGSLAIRPG